MKDTVKWYQKPWFKPTAVIVGILLIILVIEFKLHNPFLKWKYAKEAISNSTTVYDMEDLITDNDPYLGNKDANIKIVEFGDFACTYCQRASSIIRELMLSYKDDVFFQFRDYPVVSQQSIWLAMAASCAHEQNKFWAFHDKLYQNQGNINEDNIYETAKSVGLEINRFQSCLTTEKYKSEVTEDFTTGERYPIQGTPTFFLNGHMLSGVPSKENWKKLFDELIRLYKEQ